MSLVGFFFLKRVVAWGSVRCVFLAWLALPTRAWIFLVSHPGSDGCRLGVFGVGARSGVCTELGGVGLLLAFSNVIYALLAFKGVSKSLIS